MYPTTDHLSPSGIVSDFLDSSALVISFAKILKMVNAHAFPGFSFIFSVLRFDPADFLITADRWNDMLTSHVTFKVHE